jgi:cation diffusion facilitator CzcD-associated flavoprotein CzcO
MSSRQGHPTDVGVDQVGEVDAVIVGAGLAGLYMLHRLRGLGLSAQVYEVGSGVGGTWHWNRYPGARCDVESMEYAYSFSDELLEDWRWTERYPAQPEILRYINHVADRFDLRRNIRFETRVTAAVFKEEAYRWRIRTDNGASVSARFCIMAVGCLSAAQIPMIKGLETFAGPWYHTGRRPHEGVDFTGRRVGVIGTGSSGIQSIPVIAQQATHLFVFQRTANFSLPARNAPLDADHERWVKAHHDEHRRLARESSSGLIVPVNEQSALAASPEQRRQEYEARWAHGGIGFMAAFTDLGSNKEANDTAAEFIRAKIRAAVSDPAVAEALLPMDYPVGSKRVCVDTDYYATFNRANVTLVDIRKAPIEEITPRGPRTRTATYAVDNIVFATGFDAMTGALFQIDIRTGAGNTLKEKWAGGPRTYLGVATAGFPNLFLITGPGSPSVLSNMIVSIEQHVDWIADCIATLGERHLKGIEATVEAEDDWVAHVNEAADATLYRLADSWYLGANIPGKPRIFMPYVGGVGAYRQRCAAVAANDYEGFRLIG